MEGVMVARVALAHRGIGLEDGVDLSQLLSGQVDVPRGVVLIEVCGIRGAGDGDNVGALRVQPGERQLSHLYIRQISCVYRIGNVSTG